MLTITLPVSSDFQGENGLFLGINCERDLQETFPFFQGSDRVIITKISGRESLESTAIVDIRP